MSVYTTPYCNTHLEMASVEDVVMESTGLERAASGSSTVDHPSSDQQSDKQPLLLNDSNEEVLDFDTDFAVPPLFQCKLSEEMLKDG